MKTGLLTKPLVKAFSEIKALEIIRQSGFDAVDFSMHQYALSDPIYDLPPDLYVRRFRDTARVMKDLGLKACQLHTEYPTWLEGEDSLNERRLTAVRRGILAAAILNCPYAVVHPATPGFVVWGPKEREVAWRINLDFYKSLIPYASEAGVRIGIENMFSFDDRRRVYYANHASTAKDLNLYIDRLNQEAGSELFVACLDTGHANVLGLSAADAVRELGSRLHLLHIHDNSGNRDDHTIPYAGTVDWDGFLSALKEIRYREYLSLETHGFLEAFPDGIKPEAVRLLYSVDQSFEKRLYGETV